MCGGSPPSPKVEWATSIASLVCSPGLLDGGHSCDIGPHSSTKNVMQLYTVAEMSTQLGLILSAQGRPHGFSGGGGQHEVGIDQTYPRGSCHSLIYITSSFRTRLRVPTHSAIPYIPEWSCVIRRDLISTYMCNVSALVQYWLRRITSTLT
ncbi:hypothetical protein GW17_00052434 [Ensete ventricosum]|nr:hypothetical protein GW17_00052434 [Ensete ventricosum]